MLADSSSNAQTTNQSANGMGDKSAANIQRHSVCCESVDLATQSGRDFLWCGIALFGPIAHDVTCFLPSN